MSVRNFLGGLLRPGATTPVAQEAVSSALQALPLSPVFVYEMLRHTAPRLCLDVGAANGQTTRLIKKYAAQARVMAFEPFPGNAALLRENLAALKDVTIVTAAVADVVGRRSFHCPQVRADGGSNVGYLAAEDWRRDPDEMVEVDVVRLDDVVRQHVDFLKIDVQGGEIGVLRGAEELIRERGVDLMFVEYSGQDDVIALLAADYLLFDTDYAGWGDPVWADQWLTDVKRGKQTTGADAFRGKLAKVVPRDIKGYAAWLRAQKDVQTDLLAVHKSFHGAFEIALQRLIAGNA